MDNYKNKIIGVLGLGVSGQSAIKYFSENSKKIIAWDDAIGIRKTFKKKKINIKNLSISKNLRLIDLLFVSPGIKPKHLVLMLAKKLKINITSDLDVFWEEALNRKNKFIVVTGSNGKSTVTSMIHHLLRLTNKKVFIGGNIGIPILSLKIPNNSSYYVIEASSYQLELMNKLKPDISILTNIIPDHIEWHGSMKKYISAKEKIFLNQNNNDLAIINVDNLEGFNLYKKINKRKIKPIIIKISLRKKLNNTIYLSKENIIDNLDNKNIIIGKVEDLTSLKGLHNIENILFTIAVSMHIGLTHNEIRYNLPKFKSLPNRLETVYEDTEIEIINDSKATNLESCKVALSCFDDIIWIAGGRRKKEEFTYLNNNINNIKAGFFIGESAEQFVNYFKDYFYCKNSINIKDAVSDSLKFSQTLKNYNTVLFSPGCSSFDQFKNFEDRGKIFKKMINNRMFRESL